MKLTNASDKLMTFFVKNNCLLPIKQTKHTDGILKILYNDIKSGVSYVNEEKSRMGKSFYKLQFDVIRSVHDIPHPETFSPNSFPAEVRTYIVEHSIGTLKYNINLFDRNIEICFIVEVWEDPDWIKKYNEYVDYMLVWLYMVDMNASRDCSSKLKIFIYHTKLLKFLPNTNIEILNENNVNTAFTRTCPNNSEIVIFRKEEWFKVFIHETFHNFGLDFSDMNLLSCNEKMLSIFPVNSEVNLYESYTECWARIINALFCSFINMDDKHNVNDFLHNVEYFIGFERIFSFFQMVKVLDFMGLKYQHLYDKSDISGNLRGSLYRENTNVLSYYIITSILLNNYKDFLSWCNMNNTSLLQFKKTNNNLEKYCRFIEKKYDTKDMIDGVKCMENVYNKLNKKTYKKGSKKENEHMYLLRNLRMTICELG
jgi:hypothetical protein